VKEAVLLTKEANPNVSMRRVCSILGVSRNHLRSAPCKRAKSDRELTREIRAVHDASSGRYGSPRIHDELLERGTRTSRKRVIRLMQNEGIVAKRSHKFVPTTNSNHELPIAENLLAREFEPTAKDEVWAGDITYVLVGTRFAYLSVIVDLYARRVVGFHLSGTLETSGPLAALAMAVHERTPASGILAHHDRGCQYASEAYGKVLDAIGATLSMSRKGNCWDNAVAESFFASLKTELGATFASFEQARFRITEYIAWYNASRRHSFNRGLSPIKKELATYIQMVA
jgi:putative transposase